MNKKEILDTLSRFGIHPSKKLGQNFLFDDNLLNFIALKADISEGDFVVEIGPGLGALTRKILAYHANLTCIEFDSRLADYLKSNIKSPNLRLIESDALKLDYNELLKDKPDCKLIANLPYSITTPLLARIVKSLFLPKKMLLLLQKETGERFAASPSTKEYGAITVKLQSLYDIKILRNVPPNVFYPKPEVVSAIVEFKLKGIPIDNHLLEKLDKLVKLGFSHRRKKIIKNLSSSYSLEQLKTAFNTLSISDGARAEHIAVDTYIQLAKML